MRRHGEERTGILGSFWPRASAPRQIGCTGVRVRIPVEQGARAPCRNLPAAVAPPGHRRRLHESPKPGISCGDATLWPGICLQGPVPWPPLPAERRHGSPASFREESCSQRDRHLYEDLARVKDALGVKHGLDLLHEADGSRGLAEVQELWLGRPDAVLGTDAAAMLGCGGGCSGQWAGGGT